MVQRADMAGQKKPKRVGIEKGAKKSEEKKCPNGLIRHVRKGWEIGPRKLHDAWMMGKPRGSHMAFKLHIHMHAKLRRAGDLPVPSLAGSGR